MAIIRECKLSTAVNSHLRGHHYVTQNYRDAWDVHY